MNFAKIHLPKLYQNLFLSLPHISIYRY
uniref:Uncharacterized protein n=1 Tax=Arundo donax TaxID=35708 RepID=A0A0A9C2I7_ARUDO